jgi:predicted dehydrogenase
MAAGGPDHPTPLRLGVLGCADIAWRRTLPAIAAAPSVRLAAVASRAPDKADAFAARFGCAAVYGYDRLLDRDDVDAVYVPLPVGLRRDWVGRALRTGRHVLAEKPLTTTRDHAAELVALAARRGVVLMENFTFPHHAQHARVRELIADGAVGRVRAFMSEFGVPERDPGDIRVDPALGGGALLDVGVYPLRIAQYFFGDALRVRGAVLHRDPATGVDVGGGVLLDTGAGAVVQLGFGFGLHYRNTYTHWGSDGSLRLDRAFTPPEDLRPVVHVQRQDGTAEAVECAADHQFRNTLEAFAAAVRTGRGGDPEAVLALAGLVDRVRDAAG